MKLATIESLVGWLVAATLVVFTFWLFNDKDALRDASFQKKKPFSFSRVQLWWWTTLILGVWSLVYATRHQLWQFNEDCLVLLGLSVGTTVTGRIIDDRARTTGTAEMAATSEGFFRDLLSDGTGVSVHRFQCFVFNVTYGIHFVVRSFAGSDVGFPKFDATTLALLGASSGGYLMVKATESTSAAADASARTLPRRAPVLREPKPEPIGPVEE